MILLRVNISEESGEVLQVQRLAHGDGKVTVRERELLRRFLGALTREMGAFSKEIGGGEVVSRVQVVGSRGERERGSRGDSPPHPFTPAPLPPLKSDAVERVPTEVEANAS